MPLIGELAPSLGWTYPLVDESRRCYVAVLHHNSDASNLTYFFENIRLGTDWQEPIAISTGLAIPRKTSWLTQQGCVCSYNYGSIQVQPQAFPPWMLEIMAVYMPMCGLKDITEWPDSCNVNMYEDGESSVGWHADDEVLFQGRHNDIRILSLSLGATRTFELRKSWPEEGEIPEERLLLGNGTLCTMEGMTQKHYRHRVPKERNVPGPRINLTWRWILKHNQGCSKRNGHKP